MNDEADGRALFRTYSEVNDQLKALEGKHDVQSNERRDGLLEELMCMDMALGPYRRAMAQPPQKSPTDQAADATD